MRKGIPNLVALQIFEAAARHESFTRAANELSLTQSAVCRQVAGLESRLGVALFLRVKKRIVLTTHGRDYAALVRKNLDRIERDTLELMAQRGVGRILEIAVVPTLASQWLIPRLPQFRALRPDITVNLSIRRAFPVQRFALRRRAVFRRFGMARHTGEAAVPRGQCRAGVQSFPARRECAR